MSENQSPKWVVEVSDKFSSGVSHAFILHGNVSDYVFCGISVRSYLVKMLASREVIAFYNRSSGISFPVESMRDEFMKIVGLSGEDNSEMSEVLAALGGGSQASGGDLPTNPGSALPLLERFLRESPEGSAAVVVEYAETIVPDGDVAVMSPDDRTNLVTVVRWGRDPKIQANGNVVFLVTENLISVNQAIRAAASKFEAIEIPFPNSDDRKGFVDFYLSENPVDMEMTAVSLANLTAGLSLVHIEDIFLRAEIEGVLSVDLVKERKDSIVSSEFGDVIEIVDPEYGFERIGGLEHVKNFFRKSVIRPMREGNLGRVPMGVLMTGPAGTGKSAVAVAVAKESGVNFVVLNLARILGQYVGNSERNLEKALRVIKSMSPTIVFIDEIDQSISRGSGGDSGVSNRIFKRLLEFMSDTGNRGRVMFLAATNRPDLMDAALRRPGRFDKKVPFLVPNEREREAIFQVMTGVYGVDVSGIPVEAISNTSGWTGAEIEAAVVKASELVYDEDLFPMDAIVEATRRLSPSTSDIEFMTMLAIQETNDIDLLPEEWRERAKDRKAVEKAVEENRPAEDRRRGGRSL